MAGLEPYVKLAESLGLQGQELINFVCGLYMSVALYFKTGVGRCPLKYTGNAQEHS